jgi:pimeloyl-ACP methyl ester carboxylesterase
MKKPIFIGILALLLLSLVSFNSSFLFAQKLKPGPQDLCFFSSVDETAQPYSIYIPKNFDETRKYPLVVFLHGAMSNNRLGLRRVFGVGNIQGRDFITPGFVPEENDLEVTRYFPAMKDVDYIVVAPYARGTAGYQGIPEQDVFDMLADVKSRFQIDEDRIYLTGLSMGGGGTLWLGLSRPDIWAALAPCCPAAPDGTVELAGNAINIPVHLFVGDKDFLYQPAIEWKKRLEAINTRVDFIEYPGIGHNSWEYAYKDGFIFEWFSQFKRDLFPQEVNFSTKWYKYNKAYWVKIDKLTPGTLANVDAKFTGDNTLEISTKDIEAVTLTLSGHPKFNPGKTVIVKIDSKSFSLKSPSAISFSKEKGEWVNKKYTPGLLSKQLGAEGPVTAAISNNHVYVYGTGGNPAPEELAARIAEAANAANWSNDRGMMGRIMVFPRVVSDIGIRPSDLKTSNLVLFGTKETNSVIAKYSDLLPIQLNQDAKDYGLVYIFPLNGHYVLVNSGLPWWTPPAPKEGAQASGMMSMSILPSQLSPLQRIEDFILFKNTPDNIISHGYFDNEWALPATEVSKLKASGVVNLK